MPIYKTLRGVPGCFFHSHQIVVPFRTDKFTCLEMGVVLKVRPMRINGSMRLRLMGRNPANVARRRLSFADEQPPHASSGGSSTAVKA